MTRRWPAVTRSAANPAARAGKLRWHSHRRRRSSRDAADRSPSRRGTRCRSRRMKRDAPALDIIPMFVRMRNRIAAQRGQGAPPAGSRVSSQANHLQALVVVHADLRPFDTPRIDAPPLAARVDPPAGRPAADRSRRSSATRGPRWRPRAQRVLDHGSGCSRRDRDRRVRVDASDLLGTDARNLEARVHLGK